MEQPPFFEYLSGYARCRPEGTFTLEQGMQQVLAAITYAREQSIDKLLVDTTRMVTPGMPTTLDRYTLGVTFAQAARSSVRVAVIVKPEMIDPERFGVTVATNRGMQVNVFTNEADALAWLDQS
jgi:hypothetical protein